MIVLIVQLPVLETLLEAIERGHHLGSMSVADTIRRKLTERFSPIRLEVEDQSHHHIGHEGARPGGETHFAVTLVSAAFTGQSRVARQRLVYQTLSDELAAGVHALSLTILAPDETLPARNSA